MATDSGAPSGVGQHMLDLAGALRHCLPALGFPDHAEGRALVARARGAGLDAEAVGDWPAWLAGTRADLLHVHAGIGWEGHGLVALGAAAGLPVVRTEHLPWLITDAEQRGDYARMVARVSALIAVSHEAAASWRAALRHMPGPHLPLACVPNGVPAPLQVTGEREAATLLCVGRLTPQKAQGVLLDAVERLGRPVRLLLVGRGEDDALRQRAARMGGVEILGPRDDVPALMAQATLLVLPSLFEGLPLVVLEAMAAGLPVVATRIGGVTEALGEDYPWLAEPGDADSLARAIRRALDDPARTHVAKLARARWAARFTAEGMAQATRRIYASARGELGEGLMTKTRIGFIGAGGIAHRHFGTLQSMPDVEIRAVADPDEGRAREAAERTGARAYADHDAMLAAEELDAVYICVPPFAHGAPERACIARGLPFLVEKPLSLDLQLAEEIAAEVEAAGLITATGYHWRYLDVVDEARRLLRENPAHLMSGYWLDSTPPPRWWWREDAGGGQIVEQATHIIDLARFLAGDVTEVFGLAAHRDREGFDGLDVPTASTATLRFASGAIANLSATCLLKWSHRVGLHVFADGLALEITDHDMMVDVGAGRPMRGAEGDPVWRMDRDFVEAVQGGENLIRAPYAEALTTHRVALAAAQSAKSGEVAKLGGLRANPQPPFRRPAPARAD